MTKQYKPDNMPDIIPYLVVRDAQKSLDFYRDAFGFEVISIMQDDNKNLQHVEMRRGNIVIMFCPEGVMGMTTKSPFSNGIEESISLYCYCEDVDALYAKAVECGAKATMPPGDRFWGDKMCMIMDLDSYKWSFATYLG